jgi:hypothetical protein
MLDRKKKIREELPLPEDVEKIEVTTHQDKQPVFIDGPMKKPYTKALWKNDTYTYVCNECQVNYSDEDDMIMHVIKHYPLADQSSVMDKLIKEK